MKAWLTTPPPLRCALAVFHALPADYAQCHSHNRKNKNGTNTHWLSQTPPSLCLQCKRVFTGDFSFCFKDHPLILAGDLNVALHPSPDTSHGYKQKLLRCIKNKPTYCPIAGHVANPQPERT